MSGRTHGVGPNHPGDDLGWALHREAAGDTGPQAPPSPCPTPLGMNSPSVFVGESDYIRLKTSTIDMFLLWLSVLTDN